jgi:hypothetical protein
MLLRRRATGIGAFHPYNVRRINHYVGSTQMYAITHAATALIIKRRFRSAPMWPLLVSVQAIELLWVAFVYVGIEHVSYTPDTVHLDFLPYSHSIGSTGAVALMAWLFVRYRHNQPAVAVAVVLGIASHVFLDLIHHEPDIAVLPLRAGPRIGLGLATWPVADLLVELAYGTMCWFVFRGGKGLLAAIVGLNLMDIPLMFPRAGTGTMLAERPFVLPTIILVQILLTWSAVWYFARKCSHELRERPGTSVTK